MDVHDSIAVLHIHPVLGSEHAEFGSLVPYIYSSYGRCPCDISDRTPETDDAEAVLSQAVECHCSCCRLCSGGIYARVHGSEE